MAGLDLLRSPSGELLDEERDLLDDTHNNVNELEKKIKKLNNNMPVSNHKEISVPADIPCREN